MDGNGVGPGQSGVKTHLDVGVKESEQSPEWGSTVDNISGYPVILTNTVFEHVIPRSFGTKTHRGRDEEATLLHNLTNEWQLTPELGFCVSGDYLSDMSLPKYFIKPSSKEDVPQENKAPIEIDVLFVATEKRALPFEHLPDQQLGCFIIHPDTTDSCTLMLEVINQDKTVDELKVTTGDKTFLSSRNLLLGMRNVFSKSIEKGGFGLNFDIEGDLLKISQHDPELLLVSDLSKIIVLPCPVWPQEAMDFIKRERIEGWPREDVINEIHQLGCHVYPDKTSRVNWVYLFSEAEKLIERELNATQIRCYQLIIILLRAEPSIVKLAKKHIKTVLLWESEKSPNSLWNPSNISLCVYQVLDAYLSALESSNLPHYFMSSCNILKSVPRSEISNIMTGLQNIRQDPLAYTVRFLSNFRFEHLPLFADDTVLLQNCLKKREIAWSQATGEQVAMEYLRLSATSLLLEDRVGESIDTILAAGKVGGEMSSIKRTIQQAEQVTSTCMAKISVETMTSFYEGVIQVAKENTIETEKIRSLLSNAGCWYNVAWNFAESTEEKQRIKARAKQLFEEAISCNDVKNSSFVDYSHCLFIWEEYEEVVRLLDKIMNEKTRESVSRNFYGIHPDEPLAGCLAEEVEACGSFSVDSVALAHYLLVCSYLKLDQISSAKNALKEFTEFNDTWQPADMKEKAPVFILLGSADEKMGSYADALVQYEYAKTIMNTHPLLDDKIETLSAILMSLESS